MATLKDIAKETGLSTSSVSRVLNYDENLKISEEKKKLIFKVADKLNYKTVNMRKLTEGTILIICTLTKQEELNDPYYISIRTGATDYCIEKKYSFKIIYQEDLKVADFKLYSGYVVIGSLDKKFINAARENAQKLVFVDTESHNKDFNCVTVDLKHATKLAVEKLASTVESELMYIGPFIEGDEFDLRYTNFKMYTELYNKKAVYLETNFSTFDAYQKLLMTNIDNVGGIFCANDTIAIGVLKYLNEREIKVGEQVQVIGVNDLPVAKTSLPPLSTIVIHSTYMGEVAIRRLIELMHSTSEHRINYVVHCKLVERQTTK